MSRTRTEEITANPWGVIALLIVCLIVIVATGCATTGPATQDSIERQAYRSGRVGTVGYLAVRDHLSAERREATRLAYIAFGGYLDAAHASGMESVRLDAAAVAVIVSDISEPWRGLASEALLEVIAQVRQRIPPDVAGLDPRRVALAVHRGIGDVLAERGINVTAEVSP